MSQAPSMPLFCDAYLADTMHLSLEEHGAYLKLLMITWRNNGQPLPDNDTKIARMLGVTPSRWTSKLRPALAPFFDLSAGTWRQKKLEKTWQFAMKTREKNREKANARWNGNSLTNNDTCDATASARHMPKPPSGICDHIQYQDNTTLPPPYQDAPHEGGGGGSSEDGSKGKGGDAVPTPGDAVPAGDLEAKAVCEAFRRLVAERWPGGEPDAVPSASLLRQAREYLDQGATVALLDEVMAAGMDRAKDQGKGAVRSLRFFRLSVAEAIAQAKSGKAPTEAQSGLTGATDWQPTASLDEVPDGWRKRVAGLLPGGATEYRSWIAGLPEPSLSDRTAVFVEPKKFRRDWIANHYSQFLANALGVRRVEITTQPHAQG
jgi:uncharacterized protein YdaU (DUF1376 family)